MKEVIFALRGGKDHGIQPGRRLFCRFYFWFSAWIFPQRMSQQIILVPRDLSLVTRRRARGR
jgi:hypothetical protein